MATPQGQTAWQPGSNPQVIPTGPNPQAQRPQAPPREQAQAVTKVRKPYTITKQRERWTDEEHEKFLDALKRFGRAWRRIEEHIGTKTAVQIRSHAQKFFSKIEREQSNGCAGASGEESISIPPPRPKRKPSHPYPRKATATKHDATATPRAAIEAQKGTEGGPPAAQHVAPPPRVAEHGDQAASMSPFPPGMLPQMPLHLRGSFPHPVSFYNYVASAMAAQQAAASLPGMPYVVGKVPNGARPDDPNMMLAKGGFPANFLAHAPKQREGPLPFAAPGMEAAGDLWDRAARPASRTDTKDQKAPAGPDGERDSGTEGSNSSDSSRDAQRHLQSSATTGSDDRTEAPAVQAVATATGPRVMENLTPDQRKALQEGINPFPWPGPYHHPSVGSIPMGFPGWPHPSMASSVAYNPAMWPPSSESAMGAVWWGYPGYAFPPPYAMHQPIPISPHQRSSPRVGPVSVAGQTDNGSAFATSMSGDAHPPFPPTFQSAQVHSPAQQKVHQKPHKAAHKQPAQPPPHQRPPVQSPPASKALPSAKRRAERVTKMRESKARRSVSGSTGERSGSGRENSPEERDNGNQGNSGATSDRLGRDGNKKLGVWEGTDTPVPKPVGKGKETTPPSSLTGLSDGPNGSDKVQLCVG